MSARESAAERRVAVCLESSGFCQGQGYRANDGDEQGVPLAQLLLLFADREHGPSPNATGALQGPGGPRWFFVGAGAKKGGLPFFVRDAPGFVATFFLVGGGADIHWAALSLTPWFRAAPGAHSVDGHLAGGRKTRSEAFAGRQGRCDSSSNFLASSIARREKLSIVAKPCASSSCQQLTRTPLTPFFAAVLFARRLASL